MSDPRDTVALPRFMRVAQAAEYLDVSTRHVEKLLAAGEIEGIDVAGEGASRPAIRLSVRSVRDFLERRAVKRWRNERRGIAGARTRAGSS